MSNLKQLLELKKYTENIVKHIGSKKNMQVFGDVVVEEIQKNVRLGYGAGTDGGPRGKLLPLDKKYKKQRKKGGLDSTTSPNKSNLTFSGEMLKSMKATFEKIGRVVISFHGMHKAAKMANAALAAIHDQGIGKMPKRPFFRLTRTGVNKVDREVERIIKSQVKKELTKILKG